MIPLQARVSRNLLEKNEVSNISIIPIAESRTFVAWARNRYGVFPESGFAGDGRYPESFVYAGEERATIGCNQTGHEVS